MRKLIFTLLLSISAQAAVTRSAASGRAQKPGAFFPLNKSGGDLCDWLIGSSNTAGSWWCLKGDGTNAAGAGQTLSSTGSPTTVATPFYPAGADRGAASAQRFNGTTQNYKTADVASPTGDVSVAAVFRDASPGTEILIGKWNSGEANNRAMNLYLNGAGSIVCEVYKTDASSTQVVNSGSAWTTGAWHIAVCVYDYVTDGTSTIRVYMDGALLPSSDTAAVGPMQVAASTGWYVADREGDTKLSGDVVGAAMVEKALSANQIAQLSRHVFGHRGFSALSVRQDEGEFEVAPTFARATVARDVVDGAVVTWPSGVPRISKNGFLAEPSATNVLLRAEEFDNASWTKETGVTVTANNVAAPDATTTADKVDYPADNTKRLYQGMNGLGTLASRSFICSMWIRADSAQAMTLRQQATVGSHDTSITATTAWTRFTDTITYGGGEGAVTHFCLLNNPDNAVKTVYVWGAQVEESTAVTSYIPTTSAAATRNADQYATSSTGLSGTLGCTGACLTPTWSGNFPSAGVGLLVSGNAALTARLPDMAVADVRGYDGINLPSVSVTHTTGVRECYTVEWSQGGGAFSVRKSDGTLNTAGFAGMVFDSTLGIGGQGEGNLINGYVSNIRLGLNGVASTSCR